MPNAVLINLSALALTAFWSVQAQPGEQARGRWWFWFVLLLALSAVVAWLLGREAGRRTAMPHLPPPLPEPERTTPPAPQMAASAPATPPVAAPVVTAPSPPPSARMAEPPIPVSAEPDDLTIIEGIGPKIRSVLQTAGITTFAELAETESGRLKEILVEAGLRIHNPTTWPEQAELARAGRWEELRALQSQLSAGRRS